MQEQETVYHFQGVELSWLQLFDIFVFLKSCEILSPKDGPSFFLFVDPAEDDWSSQTHWPLSEYMCCRLTPNRWIPSFEDNSFSSLSFWSTTSNALS
mmetsp:Transcript_4582/g.29042  ORF Transcript_4582/g.29042 Transcript_4582/m.29042 type:complete len:97 (-) Transcript_4582:2010-2300(-)